MPHTRPILNAKIETESKLEIIRQVLGKAFVDAPVRDTLTIRLKKSFLPLFATHPYLREEDGLIYLSSTDAFGGDDGIRVRDKHPVGFRLWLEQLTEGPVHQEWGRDPLQ